MAKAGTKAAKNLASRIKNFEAMQNNKECSSKIIRTLNKPGSLKPVR